MTARRPRRTRDVRPTYSEAELDRAARHLAEAVDLPDGPLGSRRVPVIGHEDDDSGLFAEVIDPPLDAEAICTSVAGVPVRVVPVTSGPVLVWRCFTSNIDTPFYR